MSFTNNFSLNPHLQQTHVPIQQPVSVISNDDISKCSVVYNPLFPSGAIGYPYAPFISDWKFENSEFITGFSKLSQSQFVGMAFPDQTNPANQQYPTKADLNQSSSIIDQPTIIPEKDFDFSVTNMFRIVQPLLFNIAQRYALNQPFIRSHFAPFFQSTNLKQVKISEMAICNLLCHSFFTYLTHHDEAQSIIQYNQSQNDELLHIMHKFMDDAVNNPEIMAYYVNVLSLEKRRGDTNKKVFVVPKPEKAMLTCQYLKGFLLSKLYRANINRQMGNLTESKDELVDLLPLSYPQSGTTLPSIPSCYPEQQREICTAFDFADIRVSLILTLFALGAGQDLEQFIDMGYYVQQQIQTYHGSNFCRSDNLLDLEFKEQKYTAFIQTTEKPSVSQDILAYILHIQQNLCIKCPYICCQPQRDIQIEEETYFFEQKNYTDYRSVYSTEFQQKYDYYEQAGQSSEMVTTQNNIKINKNLAQIPLHCKQQVNIDTNIFSPQLIIDQQPVDRELDIQKNHSLPDLIPNKQFLKKSMQIQRENIQHYAQINGIEDLQMRHNIQKTNTGNNSLPLQSQNFTINKKLNYDSYDTFSQNQVLLNTYNNNTFKMTKDFEFVLNSIYYYQKSQTKMSLSDLFFYGDLYTYSNDKISVSFKNQQKPYGFGIKQTNQPFDLSNTVINYSFLLLQLNKRVLWANRLAKFINKSKILSNCYCCSGQQQIPFYFGAKALANCASNFHNFDHIYYFLENFPQPQQIPLNLLYQAFHVNSFVPVFLTNTRRLPDIGVIRQLLLSLQAEEIQFQRTPQTSLLTQQQKSINAVIYTSDFGHFWRSDDHLQQILIQQQLNIQNDKTDFYLNNKIQLPSVLNFLKLSFESFVEFELINLSNIQHSLNQQYYNRLNSQVQQNEKEENNDLLAISSMANNHLFVPQSYINIQNLGMSKANIYSMMFEKRFQFSYKLQKDDLTTILNLNHSYINVQRNLSRVLGSLLQQCSMLEVNQIIAHVFNLLNQQFQTQNISNFSQLQYFSLELYNIVVQKIEKLLPQISNVQDVQKPIIKSNKKSKKEEKKKKEVAQVVTQLDSYILTEQDPIWSLMQQNSGLLLSFALNQVLRQQEILQENHQYVIQQQSQQKNNVKIQVQSQTFLTYQFQSLLQHYFTLNPHYENTPFFKSLVNLLAYQGQSNFYTILLSFIYSQKDFATLCNQHNVKQFDYRLNERYTGNSYIPDDNIPYGSFWTSFFLKANKTAIYCSVPAIINVNSQFLSNNFKQIQNDKHRLLAEDLGKMTLPVEVGKLQGLNTFYLSIVSSNPSQLWVVVNHYQFSIIDVLHGLQLATMVGNQFIIRILINYTSSLFKNENAEQQVALSNSARKKFNTQNQGHQLPFLKIDEQDPITQKIVDIQQILTAYFVDKLNLVYENQEPLYWSNKSYVNNFNKQKQETHIYRQIYPLKNNFLVNQTCQIFKDANMIIGDSYQFQFYYMFNIFNNNSRFCVNNSCQVCKLHKSIIKNFNNELIQNSVNNIVDQCVLKSSVQYSLSTQLSNFSHAKKSIVQSVMSKNLSQSLQSLNSISNFNLYLVFKRGRTINLTQIKQENTQILKLANVDFIPLTTPLTLSAQLYSECLGELLVTYKKDLNNNLITNSYLNHQDGLGLTALNHAMIVYLQQADKMLKYQVEVDEIRKLNPTKVINVTQEMLQCKEMYKQTFQNLQLIIQFQPNSFIADKHGITTRDRLSMFIIEQRLLALQDYNFFELFNFSEMPLIMIYQNNDQIIKQQCEQFISSGIPIKRVIQQYSTLPDNRLKNKLQSIQTLLNKTVLFQDLRFGFDLMKYQNLIQLETTDQDFAKIIYENIILLVKQFCQEDYSGDYIKYCNEQKCISSDIYQYQSQEIKVGPKIESFVTFEKNQKGEDYQQKDRTEIGIKLENFMFNTRNIMKTDFPINQAIITPQNTDQVESRTQMLPLCEIQQMHRFSNRIWRLFNHNGIKLNIMRSSNKILNNISVSQPLKLILSHSFRKQISDESVLFEYRKHLLRSQIISQCLNRSDNARISLIPQTDALDIQSCVKLSSLLQFGYQYSGILDYNKDKINRGIEIISQDMIVFDGLNVSLSASLSIGDNVSKRYAELTKTGPKLTADQRFQLLSQVQSRDGFVKINDTQ